MAQEKQFIEIERQVKIGRDVEHRVREGQYGNDKPWPSAFPLFSVDCFHR
jgi:hypothetical protein